VGQPLDSSARCYSPRANTPAAARAGVSAETWRSAMRPSRLGRW